MCLLYSLGSSCIFRIRKKKFWVLVLVIWFSYLPSILQLKPLLNHRTACFSLVSTWFQCAFCFLICFWLVFFKTEEFKILKIYEIFSEGALPPCFIKSYLYAGPSHSPPLVCSSLDLTGSIPSLPYCTYSDFSKTSPPSVAEPFFLGWIWLEPSHPFPTPTPGTPVKCFFPRIFLGTRSSWPKLVLPGHLQFPFEDLMLWACIHLLIFWAFLALWSSFESPVSPESSQHTQG